MFGVECSLRGKADLLEQLAAPELCCILCISNIVIQNVETRLVHNCSLALKGDGHVSTQISFRFSGNVNKKNAIELYLFIPVACRWPCAGQGTNCATWRLIV
jgi:hypothetical protein